MMKVPFIDLKREAKSIGGELISKTKEVLDSGNYISGNNVNKFEIEFAKYCGVSDAITVANGSDALRLIIQSLDIGPGDEVICPANSFIASAWTIIAAGATPVFCDVEEDFLLSVETISKCITKKTKAIMVVHLTGKLCEMSSLQRYCNHRNILIIEDSAQAIGATNKQGEKSGSFGIASGFSLHPLKNLAVYGDGGVITTNSQEVTRKIKLLRNHGLINRDECIVWGFNSRLDELQAAYGLLKLNYIEGWTEKYISIANRYSSELTDRITKPKTEEGCRDVFHNYVITVSPKKRNAIMHEMLSKGVETKIHYPIPLHLQKCAASLGYKKGDLPNTERLAESMISLPIYPSLSENEIDHVISSLNNIIKTSH